VAEEDAGTAKAVFNANSSAMRWTHSRMMLRSGSSEASEWASLFIELRERARRSTIIAQALARNKAILTLRNFAFGQARLEVAWNVTRVTWRL